MTNFFYPDGLITGISIWYGNFNPEGIRGDRGATGSQGERGERGPTGERGSTGQRGYNGTTGLQGESMYKGQYDSTKAAQYVYMVGNIIEFNGELFHLMDRLHQGQPLTDPEGTGWVSLKGNQGEKAVMYLGDFDQSKADNLEYKLGDVVRMSDGDFYQLGSVLNQNDPSTDPPQDDSEGWQKMRGERGERGSTGIQGVQGERGPSGGEPGQDGAQGERGPTGERGSTGSQGPSIFKGLYDEALAAQLFYEQGDILLFSNGEFYVLNNKLNQRDPTTTPPQSDSDGWRPLRGLQGDVGATGRSLYRGAYDPSENYQDGDVVRSTSDTKLYQLIGSNNGYPESLSSNWEILSGDTGERGATGLQGTRGQRGFNGTVGARGERGVTGGEGAKGERGETGRNGTDGKDGDRGERGATGSQGERGETGRSNFRGIYNINLNADYERGDIVTYNEDLYALIEEESGGVPGSSSSWLSLKGVPGLDGVDEGIALGWIILVGFACALIVTGVFFLIYYFLVRERGDPMARQDIYKMAAVRGNTYYAID